MMADLPADAEPDAAATDAELDAWFAEQAAATKAMRLQVFEEDRARRERQERTNGPRNGHHGAFEAGAPVGMDERPFAANGPDDAGQDAADIETRPSYPTPYDSFDEAAVPPRQRIYGTHYLRSFASLLASAGGMCKTSVQVVEALAICTGRPLLGETVHEQCNVWVVNLEDPIEEMQRRILAAMNHYDLFAGDVRGKLFVDAGRDFRLKFATQTRLGVIPNAALIRHLLHKIPENKIGAVFIDPFVNAHDVNENDNGAINAVLAEIRRVADLTNCAIGLVHHVRKGNGADADIDSVRGAGSLIGACRAARVINRMSQDEALRAGIEPSEARLTFKIEDGKANLAPPMEKATWRRMIGVRIGNGEEIGVAVAFDLPDAFTGISTADVRKVRNAIGETDPPPRENPRSAQWAGVIVADVLDLDLNEKGDKQKVITMLKTWIKTRVLTVETAFDDRAKRDVRVIFPGPTIPGEVL